MHNEARTDFQKTGRLIKRVRVRKGMTREQLATYINSSVRTIESWENGQRFPSDSAQLALYKALGLNPIEIVTGVEMYRDDLKKDLSKYLDSIGIDDRFPIEFTGINEHGELEHVNLVDYSMVITDRDGNPTGKMVPYKEYYNLP